EPHRHGPLSRSARAPALSDHWRDRPRVVARGATWASFARIEQVKRFGILNHDLTQAAGPRRAISERLLSEQRGSLARRGEEVALDRQESSHVADVAVELGDENRVLVVELGGQAPQAGGGAPGARAPGLQR